MPIEYAQLVRKLKRKEQSVIAPSRLKREIGKVDIRFTNNEPQGAHELLAGLLECWTKVYWQLCINGEVYVLFV